MYRTLAFHEDAYIPKQPMFSIDGLRHSDIETIQGHHTSRRTLLICSLILVTTTGLLATWVFIAKPHFYPKIHMVNRGLDKAPNIEKNRIFQRDSPSILASNGDILHRRDRRSVDILDSSKLRVRRKVSTHKGESSKKRENVKDKKFHYEHVTEKANYPYNDTRLPLDLIPEEYHIHLNIDLTQDNFTGIVKMKVQCEKKTDQIIFHGRRIQPVNITVMNGQSFVSYSKVSYIKQFEMFIVQLDSQLEEDKSYVVIIEYTVGFGKSLAGLYKSFYKDKGVEKTMCSTHFEPTDARSAFPCMDEPLFKAIFHISITRQKNYTALANMPLLKSTEEPFNDTVKDEFHPSVKMSTYLVAFSVNQFKYKEKKTPDGIAVRVYAREEDQERINYAVDAASTIIHYYGTFFNIKYPLPKLDLLALSDFMAGAMEDWGLVSFRSAYLIVDPELSTVEHIRQVTYVIAHELAHQWFGNLVTMKWWNDIWLNEGFANFVEMLGTNKVNPQFNALDLQVPTGWQAAISLDSLNSSHPVRQDVQKASEIDELFDTISYNKGASLLRMVQSFMGQKLENGVDSYLQAHNYSNAESDDLWECLAKASDNELNIKEIMDTWTKQRSFPIVTVSRFDNSTFKITQQSFLFAKTNSTANATKDKLAGINDTLWHIPFTYLTDKNEEATLVWFNEKEKMISVPSNVVWLKANNHTDGFYIVNYDKKTWKALTNQLKNNHQSLSPLDRAGLLHDAFKLTCDRMLDPVILLNLTRYLRFELEFIPFSMLRSKCECISILLHEKSLKQKYMKYIWRLQSHLEVPQMLDDRSDVNRMTVFERMQRYETISFGLKHNFSKELKDKVQVLFKKLVDGETSKGLSPENRALALMYGFDSNKTSHLNFLWEVFRTSPLDSDRRTIMKAFPQFKNYINETLERSMNKSITRVQDAISLLAQIVKVGFRKDVFDFVVKHYDEYKERYGGGYQMGQLFSEVAGGFNTQEMLHKVEEFLEHHPIGEKNSRTNRQILEKIRNNINRHANGTSSVEFGERVKTWLEHEEQRINGKTVTPSANHSVRSNTTCVLWKKNGVKTDC